MLVVVVCEWVDAGGWEGLGFGLGSMGHVGGGGLGWGLKGGGQLNRGVFILNIINDS